MLEGIERTTAGGIPVLWRKAPGKLLGALIFRVGRSDERLPTNGLTHMVEHLVFQGLGKEPHQRNGAVTLDHTIFAAAGDPEELSYFFTHITRQLTNPPLERFDHERKILMTEDAGRVLGAPEILLALRYGPRGPGLSAYKEFALHTAIPSHIGDWARERFTRENAVFWFSGPPPELDIDLPSGARIPLRETSPVMLPRDAWTTGPPGGFAASFLIERSVAASLLVAILQDRLQDRLRNEGGISYSIAVGYQPVSERTAQIGVFADALPEHTKEAVEVFVKTLDDVERGGISEDDLDVFRKRVFRSWSDENAVPDLLNYAATRELSSVDRPEDLRKEYEDLSATDLKNAMAGMRSSALFLVPEELKLGPTFAKLPESSSEKIKGKRLKPAGHVVGPAKQVFTVGEDGIMLEEKKQRATVRFDACEGLVHSPDGSRIFYGSDGFQITWQPQGFRGGKKAAPEIDRRLSDRIIQLRDQTESKKPPAADSTSAKVFVVLSAVLVLNGVRQIIESISEGGAAGMPWIWALTAVFAVVLAVSVWVYFRDR